MQTIVDDWYIFAELTVSLQYTYYICIYEHLNLVCTQCSTAMRIVCARYAELKADGFEYPYARFDSCLELVCRSMLSGFALTYHRGRHRYASGLCGNGNGCCSHQITMHRAENQCHIARPAQHMKWISHLCIAIEFCALTKILALCYTCFDELISWVRKSNMNRTELKSITICFYAFHLFILLSSCRYSELM